MTYDARTRDRYRLGVKAATAAVAAGAITATGWFAGAAAQAQARTDAAQQARKDAVARAKYDAWLARYGHRDPSRTSRTVLRERPSTTRVTTRYVGGATTSVPLGQGGTVSSPAPQSHTRAAAPAPPPPPPPAPPAPSNGS